MNDHELQRLLGTHISDLPEKLRFLGVTSLPVKDLPDLETDPEWDSTVWAFPDDGLSISFYSEDGGHFDNDFIVEAVLIVGCPMMGFAFYADDDPPLQKSRFLPFEGLNWSASRSELVSLLGQPTDQKVTSLIYRLNDKACSIQFDFDNDQLECMRLQVLRKP